MHREPRSGKFKQSWGEPHVVRMNMSEQDIVDLAPVDAETFAGAIELGETRVRIHAAID